MTTQTSFNAGELSPQLFGRPFLEKYANGLKQMLNTIGVPYGPAVRRPGSEFIARVKDHSKGVRLYGYEFSKVQAYILEFGEEYIRFFRNGGPIIEKTAIITGATQANPVVITAVNTFANGEVIRISLVKGMTELNEQEYTVANVSGADFELSGIDGTGFTAYISGGDADKPYQVATTYQEGELATLDKTSLNDIIYMVHVDHAQAKLTRIDHDDWSLADLVFTAPPAEWGAADYPSTTSFDNDRLWFAANPSLPMRLWGSKVGLYTDFGVSATVVDDDSLNLDLATKKANAIQWLASGLKFTVGTTGAEHLLSSKTGDGPITALSKQAPIGSANGSNSVDPVQIGNNLLHLQRQGKVLREQKYQFSSNAFEGDDLSVLAEHLTRNFGIIDMAFQKDPWKVLWCVRSDGKLLSFVYYPEQEVVGWHQHDIGGDGIVESVATIPGDNEDEAWISVKRIINGSTARYVERIHESFKGDNTDDAFFVDSGLTLDNRLDVDSVDFTDPGVVNMTGHPYLDGDVVTFRSIDLVIPAEEDYQSFQGERFTVANAAANTFECTDDGDAVDFTEYKQFSSMTVALNQTVITGLAHLEGEEVTILADGAPVDEQTVENSQITLDSQASLAHVGLFYYSQIETFPPFVQTQSGDNFADNQRINNIVVQLFKTLGMKTGPSEDKLDDYNFISDTTPLGQAGALFTGFTNDISFDGPFTRDPTVIIRQEQPLPMTILSVSTEIETEGD